MQKLLFVPVSPEVLAELCRRASFQRRRPKDEAAILLETALGFRKEPEVTPVEKEQQAKD